VGVVVGHDEFTIVEAIWVDQQSAPGTGGCPVVSAASS
jgi:hypothetical protein